MCNAITNQLTQSCLQLSSRRRLNLNLGQRRISATQVCCLRLGVLSVVVGDGRLDGILSKHGAMDWNGMLVRRCFVVDRQLTLDRREAEFLRNLGVPDLRRILQSHAPNKFSQIAGAGNGRAAAECLELDI
jgi:hypothetical protein